jgi:predicted secreted protein
MLREKRIIYTAHCVLNQNSVIKDWERAQGGFNDIIRVLLDYNIGIIQLPCPELNFSDLARPPKNKEEYDVPEFRRLSKEITEKVIRQMKEYLSNDYKILGYIGIQGSPSCDTIGTKGVFMEELQRLMDKENIQLESFDIPEGYIEGETMDIVEEFRRFIEKRLGGT